MCTYHKSMCPPTSMDSGRRVRGRGPVGGLVGVFAVGMLEDLPCKDGNAKRRWSHM